MSSPKKQKMKPLDNTEMCETPVDQHSAGGKSTAHFSSGYLEESSSAGGSNRQHIQQTDHILERFTEGKAGTSYNSFGQVSQSKSCSSLSKNINTTVASQGFHTDTLKSSVYPSKLGSYTVLHRVLHDNFLYSVGDIVSLEDGNDTYYAQIKILIEDLFCEKYAALIWLLPTNLISHGRNEFNPYLYTYGPQDDWFYSICELKFVMHSPTKAYKQFIAPTPKCSNITHVKFKARPKRKI